MMYKFLKTILIFSIICFFSYTVLLFLWGNYSPSFISGNLLYKKGSNSYNYTRLKEAESFGTTDILFLGSSHAYRGFDTRIFKKYGFKSFNLGSSAQTPIQTSLLLQKYIDKLDPKIIIYEVYPQTFCSDGIESSLDIIANSTNDYSTFEMIAKQKNVKVYNTFLYGIINDAFHGNYTNSENTTIGPNSYISGGFVSRKVEYNTVKKPYETKSWYFKDEQFAAFEENIKSIKKRKIKLYLVQAPFNKSLYQSYDNNAFFDAKMKKYGNYYNFNATLHLDGRTYFYDDDHLNQLGVAIFNKEVINKLLLNKPE